MAEHSVDAADRITFAGGVLDRYRHVCAFTHTDRELQDVLDPFIAEGVDHGDHLLFLVDPLKAAGPVNRLRHLGYPAEPLLQDHRYEVRTWSETSLRGGDFDQDAMLRLLEEVLAAGAEPRVRLIADMGWAAGRADDLIEFESKADFIHAQHEHAVICTYDLKRVDGSFVIDVLRTHPVVLIGGMLQENPYFVPPPEFLRERAQTAGR